MPTKTWNAIFAAVGLSLCTAHTELNVVPAVQSWTPAEGVFHARGAEIQLGTPASEELTSLAERFSLDLKVAGCGDHPVALPGSAGSRPSLGIFLTLDRHGDNEINPEGYRVEILGNSVFIRGSTPTGVFYGTRTLLQLLAQDKTNLTLPCGIISDYPQYRHRMLMLDVGRKPYPLPVLKDYLRMMSWYKMNELHLHLSDEAFGGAYTGFRVQCDTFPGLTSKDLFYTKKELREFQDLAHSMGITITPEIDMPGHSRVFTDYWPDIMVKGNPGYMDVTNPKTIELMKQLLDEMIPIFDAPDFHIGTDEYRVGGSKEQKEYMHEAFRQFINTMNAHIRSKGKNCRIWSGFEHMGGKSVKIDSTVIIDMWDPYNPEHDGHPVINSSQFVSYLCPGCHYYGVNPVGIYNSWEPWQQSCPTAPKKGDPRLLGGKFHVWGDQAPTGWTMTEIAKLVLPTMQAFAEKLWGTKGSKDYSEFQTRAALTQPIPGVTVFERLPARYGDDLLLNLAGEQVLPATNSVVSLTHDGQKRRDLEWPWTLTFEICKTAETGTRGVILSSDLAEICADFTRTEEQKSKDAAGKEIKTKVTRRGVGVVRAAGSAGADPASSHLVNDVSRVYSEPLPLNQWTTVSIVGERGRTTVYLNGDKAGESGEQAICPLAQLGSKTGNSFVGKIRNLKVYDRALSAKEIGRAAGLDLPDNLAAKCAVTASASDTAYGLTPDKITDGDPGTRWSSGATSAEQWVAVDLGSVVEFNAVAVAWETARPNELQVQVSSDGKDWQTVATTAVTSDKTDIRLPSARARQVRLLMSKPATQWGYSIWELEVMKRRQP
jgi:hexosaminidase